MTSMTDLHPDPARPLILAGQRYAVQKATLSIGRIATSPRNKNTDVRVAYDLTLDVDDDSGEDCSPAPMIQSIPVREAFGRWPRLDELPGLVVAVEDDRLWDAWYGNDAPPLEANRLTFGNWAGTSIHVQWSAAWGAGRGERATLAFDGAVALERIRLYLFDDEAIEALVTKIWGPDALAHFEITAIPQVAMPGTPPRQRGSRDTVSYELWPKFLAAPSHA